MTAEDYLEMLAGLKKDSSYGHKFTVEQCDLKLIHSLATQTIKNIALTDRQHLLVKTKLLQYKTQFIENGLVNVDTDLNNVRHSYRKIDRSRSIKLVLKESYEDFFHHAYKVLMMAIRFPFSKKMIKHIDLIKSLQKGNGGYDSKTKTHFVTFNEKNVFTLIDKLKDAGFIIDNEIIEYYNKIVDIYNSNEDYQPGIYNWRLRNLSKSAVIHAKSLIGDPCPKNIDIYYDRRHILGLSYFDETAVDRVLQTYDLLSKKIILRKHKNVFINKKDFVFSQIFHSILKLKRLPILFVLGNNSNNKFIHNDIITQQVYAINKLADTLIDKNEIKSSVLFRLDNSTAENIQFNQYIKDHQLNEKITTDTDIVYILSNKLPKPLLRSKWKPAVIVIFDCSRCNKFVQLFLSRSDLIIHYDNMTPYWHNNTFTMIP